MCIYVEEDTVNISYDRIFFDLALKTVHHPRNGNKFTILLALLLQPLLNVIAKYHELFFLFYWRNNQHLSFEGDNK